MRFVRCVWKNSSRKTSWESARVNMPFTESALLNGWRWGRFARCATCPSYSWHNSRTCLNQLPQHSSLCLGWRTWSRTFYKCDCHYFHTPSCTGTRSYPRTDCRIGTQSRGDLHTLKSCLGGFVKDYFQITIIDDLLNLLGLFGFSFFSPRGIMKKSLK